MVECECDVRVTPVKDLKYRRICTELRKDILSGRYNGSGAFPSIRALMMRFGLSKNTVLHALEELKKQGLISCSRGRTSAVTKIGANRQLGLVLPGIVPWSDYFRPIVDEISRLAAEEGFDLLFRDAYSATLKGRVRDVREIVAELRTNFRTDFKLIATGGFAKWVLKDLDLPFVIDPTLTLYGAGLIASHELGISN